MSKSDALPILAQACVQAEKLTGVPAELSLAQAAIESGWLQYTLGANNCHGIKYNRNRHGARVLVSTREWFTEAEKLKFLALGDGREVVRETGNHNATRKEYVVKDWFAKFYTLADCIAEHASLISTGKPYAQAWAAYQQHRNWRVLLQDIGPIYATAPDYARIVEAIVSPDVVAAIQAARNGAL